jgi:hypothetical protein
VTLPVTNNLPIAAPDRRRAGGRRCLFLIDKLIGDRVARFASVKYTVKGPWKEPKITFDKPFDALSMAKPMRQLAGTWTHKERAMSLAVIQMVSQSDVLANLAQARRLLEQAQPAAQAGGAAGKLRGHGPSRHCRHRPRRSTGRRPDPAMVETDRPRPQVMDSGRHLAVAAGGPADAKANACSLLIDDQGERGALRQAAPVRCGRGGQSRPLSRIR